MILIDVGYGGKKNVKTFLFGRNEVMKDKKFRPYIYLIPDGDIPETKLEGFVKKEEVEMQDLGGPVKAVKFTFSHPKFIRDARKELREFGEVREMDIPFVRRYMMDHKLLPLAEVTENFRKGEKEVHKLDVLAFDIETHSGSGVNIGKDPVIMISLWGEGLEKVIAWGETASEKADVVEDEKELIETFLKEVEKFGPEVVVTYNGDGFDWTVLKERAKELGVKFTVNGERVRTVRRGRERPVKLKGIVNIDLYQFIRNILSPYMKSETLDLSTVAGEFVGEGKVDIGGMKGISEAWENDPDLLYEYSLQDSKITYLLAEEVMPMIYELAKTVGQNIFDVARMTPGQVVEWFLAKEAFNEGMIIPNRPPREESYERRRLTYAGAFVKDPIKGLHSPVAVCDFRSLYPTIIMAHNISPDTLGCGHDGCEENKSPDGDCFCTKKKGFIPKKLYAVFEERMALKKKAKSLPRDSHERKITDTRQKALKLILNSFYGYLGYANARWYNLEGARSIASWGREYIKKIMKEASLHGFTVVYGDTDSVMLTSESESFEDDVRDFMKDVNAKLPDPIELELEGFFVRGLFVTKKRYGLLGEDGRLVVKGLEKVRRDWSRLARDAQERVLRLVLENKVEDAKEYVKKTVKKLRKGDVDLKDLIIRTQMTKKIGSYKQIAPHVKVARDMKEDGKDVFPGMIVEYIVTPGKGTISSKSKPPYKAESYDADYYIDNQVLPAVMRVLEAVGGSKQAHQMKQSDLGKNM